MLGSSLGGTSVPLGGSKPIILHTTPLPKIETQPHLSPQIPLQDLLSREDLDSIAKEAGEATGKKIKFDNESEKALQEIADEFIESVTTFSCEIAKHRNGETISAKDVQLHLQQNWGLDLPIPGEPETKRIKVDAEEAAGGPQAVPGQPSKPKTLHEQRLLLKAMTLHMK